jgi:hypothetical protein
MPKLSHGLLGGQDLLHGQLGRRHHVGQRVFHTRSKPYVLRAVEKGVLPQRVERELLAQDDRILQQNHPKHTKQAQEAGAGKVMPYNLVIITGRVVGLHTLHPHVNPGPYP